MPKKQTIRRAPANQANPPVKKTDIERKSAFKHNAEYGRPPRMSKHRTPPPQWHFNYIPPQTEARRTPSSQDLEPEQSGGLKKLVRDQTAASLCVGGFGFATNDPASIVVAALNTARGGTWMTALFNASSNNKLTATLHGTSHENYRKAAKLLQKFSLVKNNTKGLQSFLTQRARKAQSNESKSKQPQSQIGVDIKAAKINSLGAGAGSLIHSFQAAFSHDDMVVYGAITAAVGYSLIQIDQAIEARRWQKLHPLFKEDFKYNHSEAHALVGYTANRQYIADAVLKWVPPITMIGKGGFFSAEAIHLVQHDGSMMGATAIGLAGLFFIKSGIEEFHEQNGAKISYMKDRLLGKIPDHHEKNTTPKLEYTLDPSVYPAPEKPAKTIYLETPPQHPQAPYILAAN